MKIILICSLILFVACSDQPRDIENISFSNDSKNFEEVFSLIEEITIPTDLGDSVRIFGISKIAEYGNDEFIISDIFSTLLLKVNKLGEVTKMLGQKGEGPGEFSSLADFDISNKGKIFAIDYRANSINVYSEANFVKKARLSYVHRSPLQVLVCTDGKLLVSAFRNLTDGSSSDNYDFVPYEKNCFLNVYDNNFNFLISYLNPDEKFLKSKGVFSRPQMGSFTSSAILDDKIISMKQEGLYKIFISNCNGNITERYKINQEKFIEFDFSLIHDFKVINGKSNFDMERKGKIIASHSSPTSIHVIGEYVIITIMSPYGNYFPQFTGNSKVDKDFHFDIYKYENDELIPLAGGISTNKKIIGVSEDAGIYMVDSRYIEDRVIINVQKYSLSL